MIFYSVSPHSKIQSVSLSQLQETETKLEYFISAHDANLTGTNSKRHSDP